MIQQRNEEPSSDDDSQDDSEDDSEVEIEEESRVCCWCFTRKQKLK